MSVRSDRGKAGEQYVCGYLAEKGWRIMARNYRIRGGEIDIIAEREGILAFVEVKTRKFGSMTDGIDAVNAKKQSLLIRTAEKYMSENPAEHSEIRFDAAFVTVTSEQPPRMLGVDYIENAFDAFLMPDIYEQT